MKGPNSNWLALSSVGFQIAAGLLLFGWIGNQIDHYFLTSPYVLIIGLVLGGLFSLFQIWQSIK